VKNDSLRFVQLSDAEEILGIYAPFVEKTYISFETKTPSLEEFQKRIAGFLTFYPYLVCTIDGRIAGYSYAHRFRERAAYDWSAETTIYTAPDSRRRGVGGRLYGALTEILRLQNIKNLYAIVTAPNEASEGFHEACGFSVSGVQHNCGWKFGQWYNSKLYEKIIGTYEKEPAPIRPVRDLPPEAVQDILARFGEGEGKV